MQKKHYSKAGGYPKRRHAPTRRCTISRTCWSSGSSRTLLSSTKGGWAEGLGDEEARDGHRCHEQEGSAEWWRRDGRQEAMKRWQDTPGLLSLTNAFLPLRAGRGPTVPTTDTNTKTACARQQLPSPPGTRGTGSPTAASGWSSKTRSQARPSTPIFPPGGPCS